MNNKLSIALFTYDFPHKKTLDFIDVIYKNNFRISLILAAKYVKIKKPRRFIEPDKKKQKTSTRQIAKTKQIPYHVVEHNSQYSIKLLNQFDINLGIISGARIINKNIINQIKYGILNIHPALIPEIRGQDSVLWSIEKNIPIGVTAHLIDEHIDMGTIIKRDKINIEISDDFNTLTKKNYDLQLKVLAISLILISEKKCIEKNNFKRKNYNTYMDFEKQRDVIGKLKTYIKMNS